MQLTVDHPRNDELAALAELAARCQALPERQIPYVGDDAASIAADVVDACGGDSWPEHALVARDGDRVVGWLCAETDPDMGRLWWFGPFLEPDLDDERAGEIADALYGAAGVVRAGFDEQEICYDQRSTLLAAFGRRNGFAEADASLALRIELPAPSAGTHPDVVEPPDDAARTAVGEMHDELFPATHRTGASIASPDAPQRLTWCIAEHGTVVAYVAVEHQSDNSVYVDYLGVAAQHRRRGLARRLVAHGLAVGAELGATHAHLTVRLANEGARHVYRSLGFTEVMVIVPARKGFTLI